MLEMRPGCECCDRDLMADAGGAFVCSFECTFCEVCALDRLGGVCPNCQGQLVARPKRITTMLARHPASTKRIVKAADCSHMADT